MSERGMISQSHSAVITSIRKLFFTFGLDALALAVIGPIFVIPFMFMLSIASKTKRGASLLEFSWSLISAYSPKVRSSFIR